jgi:hypothetical protein
MQYFRCMNCYTGVAQKALPQRRYSFARLADVQAHLSMQAPTKVETPHEAVQENSATEFPLLKRTAYTTTKAPDG